MFDAELGLGDGADVEVVVVAVSPGRHCPIRARVFAAGATDQPGCQHDGREAEGTLPARSRSDRLVAIHASVVQRRQLLISAIVASPLGLVLDASASSCSSRPDRPRPHARREGSVRSYRSLSAGLTFSTRRRVPPARYPDREIVRGVAAWQNSTNPVGLERYPRQVGAEKYRLSSR